MKHKDAKSLNPAEQLTKQYLNAFQQTGVPTPGTVTAAFQKARASSSIDDWQLAAKIANSYANVVDVLTEHYSRVYHASKSGYSGGGEMKYISTAADYERVRNKYLGMRNDAYLQIAKLYLQQGDQTKALSFAVSAVSLSADKPNTDGEQLIRSIIQFEK
jgi:hypothetical protein